MSVKPARTCDECRVISPGWHWIDDGIPEHQPTAVRCPMYLAAEQAAEAQKITADVHTEAAKAARLIIADAAARLPEFSANQIRDELDAAQITGGVIGAAFSASIRAGVIEATGRTVPSTDPGTKAHRIFVYRSLHYGQRAS